MDFKILNSPVSELQTDSICIPYYKNNDLNNDLNSVNKLIGNFIDELEDKKQISSNIGSITNIYTLNKLKSKQLILVGLGDEKDLNYEKIRKASGNLGRFLNNMKNNSTSIVITGAGNDNLEFDKTADAISQGLILGAYKYDKFKTKKTPNTLNKIDLINSSTNTKVGNNYNFEKIINESESINLVRNLINEPPNYMNPDELENIAKDIVQKSELDLTVLNVKEMEELGMEVILGVGQGSKNDPKMIIINYIGDKDNKNNNIAVIGKGITFDSGGLNLKPGMSMRTMKTDMSGSAIVLGVMKAVAHQKPKKNVMGILAVAENMPGGNAQRPGDVVKAMNGKTVEIGNTDAEGRLVLSDALSYAVDNGINKIIDIATLTGAISIALGNEYTGLFGNDQKFINEFLSCAENTGEKFWQLPVDDNYSKLYKNSIADIENIGGRDAGSITGAMIIGEFAGKASWIHLDIASTITSPKDDGYNPKGPTGVSVRTILNLLKNS